MAALTSRVKCAQRIKLDVCTFNRHKLQRRLSSLPSLLNRCGLQLQYDGYFSKKRNLMMPIANVVCFHSLPTKFQKVVSFNLADLGEGIREVTVKEWFVKIGDSVAQFDKICEVQSDKASVTISSRYDGIVTKLYHEVDGKALVGEPLIDIQLAGGETRQEVADQVPPTEEPVGTKPSAISAVDSKRLAAPAVRRLAAENQVELSSVPATGKHGRVLKEDIVKHLKSIKPHTAPLTEPLPVAAISDRTQPVSGYVKAMVKTMTEAQKIPHLTYSDEMNVSELYWLCSRLRSTTLVGDIKITYMPFFIKATSNALKRYPILNASVDANCENITYKAFHNIGIAVDTPFGLIVPNIKHVEDLSIYQIATELNRLHKLGLQGALGVQDLTGGSITLSNIGAIGGTYCVPVLLPPEVAIGALGKVQVLPRFDDRGSVIKAHVLNVSWSADHRVVDGATVANFSNVWKEYIERPELILLGN